MKTFILVTTLILFPITCFAMAKTLYHGWFVVAGVRRDKIMTASVLGPLLLVFPSWFERVLVEKAKGHLHRLNPWFPITALSLLLLFGLRAFGEHLGQ